MSSKSKDVIELIEEEEVPKLSNSELDEKLQKFLGKLTKEKTEEDLHDDEIGKLFEDNKDNFEVTFDTYKSVV